MKRARRLKAACNICVLIIMIGMVMCLIADAPQDVGTAFIVMEAGAIGGIVFGHFLDKLESPLYASVIKEKTPKIEIGHKCLPEYSFIQYLQDNASSLQELLKYIDEAPDPRLVFDMVYLSYKESTKGERIQSREQVQGIIWRERGRYRAGQESKSMEGVMVYVHCNHKQKVLPEQSKKTGRSKKTGGSKTGI